jgi:hypothetical protein
MGDTTEIENDRYTLFWSPLQLGQSLTCFILDSDSKAVTKEAGIKENVFCRQLRLLESQQGVFRVRSDSNETLVPDFQCHGDSGQLQHPESRGRSNRVSSGLAQWCYSGFWVLASPPGYPLSKPVSTPFL